MESWGRQYPRGVCTAPGAGSDICFMQKIKASRSEPDLYCDPRGTLRKGTLGGKGHKTTQSRYIPRYTVSIMEGFQVQK